MPTIVTLPLAVVCLRSSLGGVRGQGLPLSCHCTVPGPGPGMRRVFDTCLLNLHRQLQHALEDSTTQKTKIPTKCFTGNSA